MDKWILCLKHGTKYSAEYVNKLYNMTTRHSSVPFKFACITENADGLDPNITVIPIPKYSVSGWWYKPWVFSSELPINGTILLLDLDIVVIKNIDSLWDFQPGKFCIIRDFNRSMIKDWNKFNSSVFRFEKGHHNYVWDNLVKDLSQTKRMHGDQDWIFSQIKTGFVFWPTEWIQSYKWEVRDRTDLIKVGNQRRFKERASPVINGSTNILVFHGDPKPSEVEDLIVVQNWI